MNQVRFCKFLCQLAVGVVLFGSSCLSAGEDLENALSLNAEIVNNLQRYHLLLEFWESEDELGHGELIHLKTTEIWCDGTRRRVIDRLLRSMGPAGWDDHGEFGEVYEYSMSPTELRQITQWDRKRPPYPEPLEYGRSQSELSVPCKIDVTDPLRFRQLVAEDRALMRWDLLPDWPMEKVAEVCTLMGSQSLQEGLARIEISATSAPQHFNSGTFEVGTVIDIDVAAGGLIRGIEYSRLGKTVRHQGTSVARDENGAAYVKEWQTIFDGRVVSALRVTKCELNQPIQDADLEVAFPEGAQVDDANGKIYLWGDGSAEMIFTVREQLRQELYARARRYQNRTIGQRGTVMDWLGGFRVTLLVNGILIATINALILLRNRLGRTGV